MDTNRFFTPGVSLQRRFFWGERVSNEAVYVSVAGEARPRKRSGGSDGGGEGNVRSGAE